MQRTTTGHVTIAFASRRSIGLQSMMKMDLICNYTSVSHVRSASEGKLCFIWPSLNKTQAINIRSATVIGRPSASYFVFLGGFYCYAGISSCRLFGIDHVVLAEERQDSSGTAIIPLKGAESTVDEG